MNSIIQYLSNLAFDNKIGFYLRPDLSSNTPSTANTENRVVVINMNWHTPEQIPFQFAHEIGHVLKDDESDKIMYFTPLKRASERNANQFAISILLPLYAEERNDSSLSKSDFMTCFAIPAHLEDLVEKEFIKYKGDLQ